MQYETYSEYKKRVEDEKNHLIKKDKMATQALLRSAPKEYTTDYNQKEDILTLYFMDGDQVTLSYSSLPDVWTLANMAGDTVDIYITQISTQDSDYLGTVADELKPEGTKKEFVQSILGKVNKNSLGSEQHE